MKCLILAGGSGDRLWPLSRRNHPKQFMEIRKGRSMFQEAVLRNIPFCDEFIIITNKRYESVAKGQLQDFQDLKYSIMMEEVPLKTAPSIVTLALNFDGGEEFLIASTDNIIEGDYNVCITKLKEVVKSGKIAALATSPKNKPSGNHYFEVNSGKVRFTTDWGKNCFVDCGVMGCKVSTLLDSIEPSFIEQCKNISIVKNVLTEKDVAVKHVGLADVMKTNKFELIKTKLVCSRIVNMNSYYNVLDKSDLDSQNVIQKQCKGVKIINTASDRLVVCNELKDIVIANTKDAVYISKSDSKKDIKDISEAFYEQKKNFFDDSAILYQDWGREEVLSYTEDYRVCKIVLFPKIEFTEKIKKDLFISLFVIDGSVSVWSKDFEERIVKGNETVSLRGGTEFVLRNPNKFRVTLFRIENRKGSSVKNTKKQEGGCFAKLKPVLKDFIWGGTKIKDLLHKNVGKNGKIAESWELCCHPAGQCKIATGKNKGVSFCQYVEEIGKENLGWKVQGYERFPLLVKFIDAKDKLSIQVHPDDAYAFPHEGDYGKNEMWYVMDAEKDACIYMGFRKDVSKEEIVSRIKDDTLLEVMNKVHVKKGETYFLKAGTVHAIGAGCFICEIQQSSNVTYRLYDYSRLGYNGKPRELHINKALEVANMEKLEGSLKTNFSVLEFSEYKKQLLGQCKYFTATKYVVNGELTLAANGASFRTVVIIEGNGKVGNDKTSYATAIGDTWFFGCNEMIGLKGNMTAIVISI